MRYILFLLIFKTLPVYLFSQSIGVGTSTPHASAALDITSTDKGLLIPRMASTGIINIPNPAKGLMVYDSVSNQLMVNMGTAVTPNWQTIVANSGWGLNGNSGINPSAQFIGSTDNKALQFRVNNVAIGNLNTSGNIFWGFRSGQSNTTAYSNVAIGTDALKLNTNKTNIIAIGDSALYNNGIAAGTDTISHATQNIAIGSKALYSNTIGFQNTANGFEALYENIDGYLNTAIGSNTLHENTSGYYNTAVGVNALHENISGYYNTSVGTFALYQNSRGYNNTAVGSNALTYNTDGAHNTATGEESLFYNTSGNDNSATGNLALFLNSTGYDNTANGFSALYHNSSGSGNTAIGSVSNYSNTSGIDNTAVGFRSFENNKGSLGSFNTAIGTQSLFYTTNSQYNTALGYNAAATYDLGYNNTILGANCDAAFAGAYNDIAIGQGVTCTDNSQARIGNSATSSIGGYAAWTKFSDGRYKKNIKEDVKGLEFIMQLRPVTYNLNVTALSQRLNESRGKEINAAMKTAMADKESITETAFVAQEVEQAAKKTGYNFSGVDKPKSDTGLYGLRYEEFVVPLVKAMQEQQQMIMDMKKRIKTLEEQNKLLQQLLIKKN